MFKKEICIISHLKEKELISRLRKNVETNRTVLFSNKKFRGRFGLHHNFNLQLNIDRGIAPIIDGKITELEDKSKIELTLYLEPATFMLFLLLPIGLVVAFIFFYTILKFFIILPAIVILLNVLKIAIDYSEAEMAIRKILK